MLFWTESSKVSYESVTIGKSLKEERRWSLVDSWRSSISGWGQSHIRATVRKQSSATAGKDQGEKKRHNQMR